MKFFPPETATEDGILPLHALLLPLSFFPLEGRRPHRPLKPSTQFASPCFLRCGATLARATFSPYFEVRQSSLIPSRCTSRPSGQRRENRSLSARRCQPTISFHLLRRQSETCEGNRSFPRFQLDPSTFLPRRWQNSK